MKGILLRWLARYDAWCQEWGLVPENRRCCAPMRWEEKAPKPQMKEKEDTLSLTESCESGRQ